MQIVIDIPEEIIENVKNGTWFGNNIISNAIENGTVLPKHGRLIDADELKEQIRTDVMGGLNYRWFIEHAPTILEAAEGR